MAGVRGALGVLVLIRIFALLQPVFDSETEDKCIRRTIDPAELIIVNAHGENVGGYHLEVLAKLVNTVERSTGGDTWRMRFRRKRSRTQLSV
jgi:hypothetical protein